MREFLIKCIKRMLADQIIWGSIFCNLILSLCFAFFYVDSGYLIAPALYGAFFAAYCIIVFFAGKKAIPFLYIVFCFAAIQDISFLNIGLFLCLMGIVYYFPKWKYGLYFIYVIDVFFVCHRHHKTIWHVLAHFALCALFYFAACSIKKKIEENAYKNMVVNQKLLLDENEELLIKQLANGRLMKEVEGFSKNTKTKYLQSAMIKNGCKTPAELIARYSISNGM